MTESVYIRRIEELNSLIEGAPDGVQAVLVANIASPAMAAERATAEAESRDDKVGFR